MNVFTAFILFLLQIYMTKGEKGPAWYYTNKTGRGSPSDWYKDFKYCGGKRQSPINLITRETVRNDNLQPIILKENWNKSLTDAEYRLLNNGHSAKISILNNEKSPILTEFKGASWRLSQFHFHWAGTNMEGSEHLLDGQAYPAEMHMVHINNKYTTTDEAIMKDDGLLVMGTFLQIRGEPNLKNPFTEIFNRFDDVAYKGDSIVIPAFPLSDLINPSSLSKYYTYSGSLTTPECQEVVTWVVFKNALNITENQIIQIRELLSEDRGYYNTHERDDPVVPRFRPTQPLNGRKVERSFGSFAVSVKSSVLLTAWLYMMILFFLL